ncbi:alkaline phosphatase 4-like isoform X2 [Neocloeon triangulifer]|uniref:alkaline phosphatase 4-like isoform X2 n=1 Tax=Neocloeon triangulifer TaxID=2078957 RepID=UPI00286EEAA3|nr:alkaline phosphatase 4-like isoform X2 [Neocloeon triangulifer]
MRSLPLISLLVLLGSLGFCENIPIAGSKIEDKNYWYEEGRLRLEEVLRRTQNLNVAKNVIIFIGDGMGLPTVTASRIYKGQLAGQSGEEANHSFELFPDVGLIKTYNTDKQVPDSAGTATALFCGVKTNYYTAGVDATATLGICDPVVNEGARVDSMLKWAQDAGKKTGLVTTARITHATPAASYSHVNDRNWECDGEIPAQYQTCTKDIARQLVEDSPGKDLNVIFGGGLQQLGFAIGDVASCIRTDGLNLTSKWESDRLVEGVSHRFVTNRGQMEGLSTEEKVLGLFGYGHMDYDLERDTSVNGSPSIIDMVQKAISMLESAANGYVLIVEGGRIDHAHHDNFAKLALAEAVKFDEAISAALNVTSRDDTLIVVTADHSHAMTMNGYPERGNDILGFAHSEPEKQPLYETLTYANGRGFNVHRKAGAIAAGEYLWNDLLLMTDREDPRYRHFAPIYESSETHGGEDVAIYAIGPYSHLFNGVFEQSYVAHAVSCAGRFGPSGTYCQI